MSGKDDPLGYYSRKQNVEREKSDKNREKHEDGVQKIIGRCISLRFLLLIVIMIMILSLSLSRDISLIFLTAIIFSLIRREKREYAEKKADISRR